MKKIIITGASKGIGKASALKLVGQGHRVHMISRSEKELLEISKTNEFLSWSKADVSDHKGISLAIDEGIKEMGGLDVVLNNAGLGYFDPVAEGKIEHWHHMVDVNIKGALSVIHTTLPHLIKSKGLLINLTSVAAHSVFPNSGVYCATKHALIAVSESLRMELGGKIRVTSISPGAVNTAFIDQTTNEDLLTDLKPYFKDSLDPDDIANQIAMVVNTPDHTMISEVIIRPSKL